MSFQFPFDSTSAAAPAPDECLGYFGTYTAGKSKGIYVARFDTRNGKFSSPELAIETKNPSYLAVHPNRPWLYAANEVENFEGKPQGAISAFRIDEKSGRLELINSQPSGGAGPCYLALDSTGACLLVANYGSGSIAALAVKPDGSLSAPNGSIQHHGSSINAQRQAGPHAHFITPDPSNKYALTCDLGLDQVMIYHLSPATASLAANDPPLAALKPGSGPRHLAFHPNGRFAYVINELSSTVTTFSYDSRSGTLRTLETHSTLPPEFKSENTCAEIQIHPSGRFLYGSNRGHNSLVLFRISPKDGRLQRADWTSSGGKTPRHFTLDPTGKWLVAENQDSDNAVIFEVNPNTGELKATGENVGIGAPVCLIFVR